MKACSACGKSFPETTEHFHRAGTRTFEGEEYVRLDHRCKSCNNERRARQIDATTALAPARVYRLSNLATGECYVGSTTTTLRRRYWQHKSAARQGRTSNLYGCMRTFGDDAYWDIAELELVTDATRVEDLREREQAWIEQLNPVLNTLNAVRKAA